MFTVKLENEGVFFPWPGELAGSDHGIKLRRLNGEDIRRLDEETTTVERVFHDGEIYHDRQPDEKKREAMRLDMTIVSWTGLLDEKTGEEIPCNPENKVRVMLRSNMVARFVGECIIKIEKAESLRAEAERKNSKRSRSGS